MKPCSRNAAGLFYGPDRLGFRPCPACFQALRALAFGLPDADPEVHRRRISRSAGEGTGDMTPTVSGGLPRKDPEACRRWSQALKMLKKKLYKCVE